MSDLKTTYLGLPLKNPLVASASPLSEDVGNIRKMEDAGLAAVVLHSMFEEQLTLESIDLDRYLSFGTESFAEALDYFPDMQDYNLGPDGYLEHIRSLKETVEIPIIGSLNGYSTGGWIRFAREIEQAGADALELNIYFLATDPTTSAQEIERMYLDLVRNVKANIQIPVAVKISPFFSAMAHFARRLDEAGADGLVLFNRFYQPDLDLDKLEVVPDLTLSDSRELRLRLRWIAVLHGRIHADMAVTGGVHKAEDVIKSMMVGARVAMTTSALLRNGIEYASQIISEISYWMEEHEYETIQQMQGSMSQRSVVDPTAFERANYMKVLRSYSLKEH